MMLDKDFRVPLTQNLCITFCDSLLFELLLQLHSLFSFLIAQASRLFCFFSSLEILLVICRKVNLIQTISMSMSSKLIMFWGWNILVYIFRCFWKTDFSKILIWAPLWFFAKILVTPSILVYYSSGEHLVMATKKGLNWSLDIFIVKHLLGTRNFHCWMLCSTCSPISIILWTFLL